MLDFDTLVPHIRKQITKVFQKHGIPIPDSSIEFNSQERYSGRLSDEEIRKKLFTNRNGTDRFEGTSFPKTDMSGPKHGKEDENNEPHVGGNTWAGGTGGSDTAGEW